MSEIIFLAVLALIVIGPKELPELARTLGRFLNELKRSTNVLGDELKQQVRMDKFDLNQTIRNPNHNNNSAPQDTATPASDAATTAENPEQLEFPQADAKSEEQKDQ
ncbi:twin-arginine translocase TatA/TatE family subunit [Bdellovibrio bacteriovorus]|uniref:Sec-independent protein translocase subunit TatA/TatB n=1 Tax=Bdellovibrio bacteriovorus TaxID=959 RepID=UPI0021D15DB0|nr:twin-arginine translocase TatA/TatE family subunit [Bdellovibrio bacteriovorus]UXR65785.1 twin-arginine translocase TatA/TatE family subunit [Bdellovibrio bacteriovorus]